MMQKNTQGRPTTWKELHLPHHHDMLELEAYHQSSKGVFNQYIIHYEKGMAIIETNLPWDLLRRWFSYSGVVMPHDILTDTMPSWERYPDDGS